MRETRNLKITKGKLQLSSRGFLKGNYHLTKFLIVVTRGCFCVKEVVEIWTPKMQRARDKWRERGNLAQIQTTVNLSRAELSKKFESEAKKKTDEISPIIVTVYQSDQQNTQDIIKESMKWIGSYHSKLLSGFGIKKS